MSDHDRNRRRHSAVIDFAHALVSAVLNRLMHVRDSRFVAGSVRELVDALDRAAALGAEMPLLLQFEEHRICHDGRALDGPSLQARSLLQRCTERQIATMSFAAGLQPDEANRLLDLLLLAENTQALSRADREATLLATGIRNVHFSLRDPADQGNRCVAPDATERAIEHYQSLADVAQQNHRLAHRDLELEVRATAGAVERALDDCDEPSMLLSLSMQDDVDRFTVGHSVRVALLALQVARELGASRDQLVRVGAAALMHDIGKSKVPQEILFKQGRLTAEEWHSMQQHPRLGAQILIEQHEQVDPRAIGAAFCHHMGPTGAGYPSGVLPMQPSATSRLIRVCDVFEALTAVRPYKKALTPIEAYAVMYRNEHDFDPVWLRRFTRTLGLFPTGTRVQLADGAEGVVVQQGDDITKPLVRLLTGPNGDTLPAEHPGLIALGEPFEGTIPRIAFISTHDRILAVPEFDRDDPAAQDTAVHHACLSPEPHDHAG